MSEIQNLNDSSVKKVRKTKKVKEGPTRAKSGYLIFCVDKRPIVVSENPSITNTDVVTELAKRWNAVKSAGGDELKKYEELAKLDKERYEQEKSVWNSNKPQDIPEEEVVVVEKTKKKVSKKKKEAVVPVDAGVEESKEEILEEDESAPVAPEPVVAPEVVVPEDKPKKAKGKGKKKA